jgi:predicted Rossmann fold nucleotide-binding protein DprA/Smf involved in DNA uptake
MKIAVVGSRTFNDYDLLKKSLDNLYPNISLIISGGAKGAYSLAEKYAKDEGIPTQIFKPNWKKYGKAAGFVRNKDIIAASDMVIAFWDCVSHGTKNSIEHAYTMNKPVIIVPDFV